MPLYEYTCRKCDHTFEVLTTVNQTASLKCPSCNSTEVERLIALPALGKVSDDRPETNCRGDGPPCGAPWCGRSTTG